MSYPNMNDRILQRHQISITRVLLDRLLRNVIPSGFNLVTIDDRDVLMKDTLNLIIEPDSSESERILNKGW